MYFLTTLFQDMLPNSPLRYLAARYFILLANLLRCGLEGDFLRCRRPKEVVILLGY